MKAGRRGLKRLGYLGDDMDVEEDHQSQSKDKEEPGNAQHPPANAAKRPRVKENPGKQKVIYTPPGKGIPVPPSTFSEARWKAKPPSWPCRKRRREPEQGNEELMPGNVTLAPGNTENDYIQPGNSEENRGKKESNQNPSGNWTPVREKVKV